MTPVMYSAAHAVGGQSVPNFDYDMAIGVRKTFAKKYLENLAKIIELYTEEEDTLDNLKEIAEDIKTKYEVYPSLDDNAHKQYVVYERLILNKKYPTLIKVKNMQKKAYSYAYKETDRATYQAMESLIHNLNTMQSRAGSQTPFSSINYGTDTSPEGRMVIKNILLAEEAGLGNGETPIFPIQIFKVKDGVNYNPGDPNYDLLELACKVSAKRLFPNFSFIDAPFNLKYYDENNPKTEVAYMGCVSGDEVVTYRYDGKIYVESFKRFWEMASDLFEEKQYGTSRYFDTTNLVEIYDSAVNGFVGCKKLIKNPNKYNWVKLTFSNGKTLVCTEDHPLPVLGDDGKYQRKFVYMMQVGDCVPNVDNQYTENKYDIEPDTAWSAGLRSVGVNVFNYATTNEITYDGNTEIPSVMFKYKQSSRIQTLAGMVDGFGTIGGDDYTTITFDITNKSFALKLKAFCEACSCVGTSIEEVCNNNEIVYRVKFYPTPGLINYLRLKKPTDVVIYKEREERPDNIKVIKITPINYNECSYDVETDSDRFDVSGINSHNCRTRVLGNEYDKSNEIVSGRGNLSFTSINLPRLAIEAHGDIDKFFITLDDEIDLVIRQLLHRFNIQCQKRVKNYPFLMGQGVWIGSENLNDSDNIAEVLKHGTLSIGFIGLAETLVALIGKHHGESDEAQKLGLKIISHMRKRMDDESEKRKLNFSLLATPAEGLSGRFVRMDAEKYGKIPGITDRDYYTNSFHIPVYYKCTAAEKIRREAPYHELTNAGHISYIELDGDPSNNLIAFMTIIRFMKENGIGYGSINHPVDRDPVCGYTGIIDDVCPKCGRREKDGPCKFDRIRRITGYLVGTLDRFNNAKLAEVKDRTKHNV